MSFLTFTLLDRDNLLEPEDHRTLAGALDRTRTAPWDGRRWMIFDPAGRLAATPATHTTTHGEHQ